MSTENAVRGHYRGDDESEEDRTAPLAAEGRPAPGALTPGALFGEGFAERTGNNIAATMAGTLAPILIVARAG